MVECSLAAWTRDTSRLTWSKGRRPLTISSVNNCFSDDVWNLKLPDLKVLHKNTFRKFLTIVSEENRQ